MPCATGRTCAHDSVRFPIKIVVGPFAAWNSQCLNDRAPSPAVQAATRGTHTPRAAESMAMRMCLRPIPPTIISNSLAWRVELSKKYWAMPLQARRCNSGYEYQFTCGHARDVWEI